MSTQQTHFLTLIIPAYKQKKTIVQNIERIQRSMADIRYDHEIIVVVDGMVDTTVKKLKKANLRKVKIVYYKENQGKSYAIRVGMHEAKGDYVMFMDSGLEIDPNGISMLLEHMEWYNADIIVGSKRHPVSYVNYPLTRRILSRGYQYIIWALFRLNVRDTQAGLKIFKRKVLKKVLPKLLVKQYAFDLEMLVVARHLGYKRIFEAPIKLKYNFYSMTRASNMRAIYGIWIDTMAIFYRLYILKYYDRKSITK